MSNNIAAFSVLKFTYPSMINFLGLSGNNFISASNCFLQQIIRGFLRTSADEKITIWIDFVHSHSVILTDLLLGFTTLNLSVSLGSIVLINFSTIFGNEKIKIHLELALSIQFSAPNRLENQTLLRKTALSIQFSVPNRLENQTLLRKTALSIQFSAPNRLENQILMLFGR